MFISIIAVVIVLSVMILSHELGHFLMARRMGVKVEIFSLGFGRKIWSIKKGETEYRICLVPFGGYVKMAGDELGDELKGEEWEFYSKPIYKRFNIIAAGSVVNYILGFLLFCLVFMVGAPMPTSRIGGILEGYPAEKAGLKENDKIVKIGGKDVKYWEEVLDLIHDEKGDLDLVVDRDGELLNFTIRGKEEDLKDIFGKPVKKTMIGIGLSKEVAYVQYGFLESISMGSKTLLNMTRLTYRVIWGMLTGQVSLKVVGGPISIIAMTGEAAKMGINHLLWISALISASLAIFNLLPFPILDGGHILFLAIEKIKGRPVDRKVQDVIGQVALVLLLMFVLVVSWNDILRHFIK